MHDDVPAPDRFRALRRLFGFLLVAAWGVFAVFFGAVVIKGGSMEPSLSPGDLMVYRRSAEFVQSGDIVLFEHPEWPSGVVHRVVRVLPDGTVVTRGDANPVQDREPVPRRRVKGVSAFVVPLGRGLRLAAEALE